MSALIGRPQNFLLNELSKEVWERLTPHVEHVTMRARHTVYDENACIRHVYFPVDCIVSMMYIMESGNSGEVAMIGHEGMTGVTVFLGAERSGSQVVVQSSGQAVRLPVSLINAEFRRGGTFMEVLLRYTQSFIAQLMDTAACNRHGTLDQRLCRWLLLNLDRTLGGELHVTHQVMASALGVKREGVTEAAGRLRRRGAISYRRGHIKVLDRPVLESAACECYKPDSRRADCSRTHAHRVQVHPSLAQTYGKVREPIAAAGLSC